MEPEPFTLRYDSDHNVLISVLRGAWDDATMTRWERSYSSALQQTRPGFGAVSDLAEYPLQTPELQARHQALMDRTIAGGLAQGVMVVSETILQMQMKRLTGGVGGDMQIVRFTASRTEAEELLGLPIGSIC